MPSKRRRWRKLMGHELHSTMYSNLLKMNKTQTMAKMARAEIAIPKKILMARLVDSMVNCCARSSCKVTDKTRAL